MSEAFLGWLAADYHLPATYSCRLPLSSANSALISPAPGPATVRLALIRASIELFGRDAVCDSLFPGFARHGCSSGRLSAWRSRGRCCALTRQMRIRDALSSASR